MRRPPGPGRAPQRPWGGRPGQDRAGPARARGGRPGGPGPGSWEERPARGRAGDRPWPERHGSFFPRPGEHEDRRQPGVDERGARDGPRPADLLGPDEELVAGRHPVEEAFAARREALRLLVVPHRREALERLVLHATSLRIPIVEVEGGTLTALAGFDGHQGIGLVARPRPHATPDEILVRAAERGEPPLVLVLDSLEDPQNLGTLLRSAEAAGVHGVLFPTRRQAPLSPAAVKASAGAVEHLLLAPVDDLAGALADLHVRGLRIVGSEADAPLVARQADLRGPTALVVGSEGQGLGSAIRRRCDLFVRIPMHGRVGSLNAAVAGSVLLYEAAAQRDAVADAGTGANVGPDAGPEVGGGPPAGAHEGAVEQATVHAVPAAPAAPTPRRRRPAGRSESTAADETVLAVRGSRSRAGKADRPAVRVGDQAGQTVRPAAPSDGSDAGADMPSGRTRSGRRRATPGAASGARPSAGARAAATLEHPAGDESLPGGPALEGSPGPVAEPPAGGRPELGGQIEAAGPGTEDRPGRA